MSAVGDDARGDAAVPPGTFDQIEDLARRGYGYEDVIVKLKLPRTAREVVRWAILGRKEK